MSIKPAERLLFMLQVSNASFPTGAFNHSYGFETWIDSELINDGSSFEVACRDWLTYSLASADGAAVAHAHRAMQVGEESITSYEIGLKADLLDGRMRLNSALFTYTYEDQQISTLSEENGVVTSRLANAGETARTGLEVELKWQGFLPFPLRLSSSDAF